ncbi:hypothetical protein F2P81_009456 [Scophthalmus maximus]|uniref:Uncharacterized protein n=1 Tax=Scophthalmus maximus TaxID=52904 RepID=A0A6A4T9Y4_SCOMX|nr:hypothetical protein F2P81_009456 [Scophthalmus maximus]
MHSIMTACECVQLTGRTDGRAGAVWTRGLVSAQISKSTHSNAAACERLPRAASGALPLYAPPECEPDKKDAKGA